MKKFEMYYDLKTIKELVDNCIDYEGELDLCMLYDLKNNISCYFEIYNGEVDLIVNKHYNNEEDEYDNYILLDLQPDLRSRKSLKKQLEEVLNKYKGEINGNK